MSQLNFALIDSRYKIVSANLLPLLWRVSMPTNFSHNTWMLTPKLGLTAGSVIRLYYGRHIWSGESVFNRMGKYQISLELNTAAFHDFKIGL